MPVFSTRIALQLDPVFRLVVAFVLRARAGLGRERQGTLADPAGIAALAVIRR